MLNSDPIKRPTIHQVLKHQWMNISFSLEDEEKLINEFDPNNLASEVELVEKRQFKVDNV